MIPLQQRTNPIESILLPIAYGLFGAAFGVVGYFKGREETEPLRWDQLAKTVGVWFVAGIVVYANPGEFNQVAVAGIATSLAPMANMLLDSFLPGFRGGSPNYGVGKKPTTTTTTRR